MNIVPFDDRDGYIWMNGEMTPWRKCKSHVITHGLHYASLVFEGERAYNGRVFKSKDHAERLFNAAKTMDMEIPFTIDEILKAKDDLLTANKLSLAGVTANPFMLFFSSVSLKMFSK